MTKELAIWKEFWEGFEGLLVLQGFGMYVGGNYWGGFGTCLAGVWKVSRVCVQDSYKNVYRKITKKSLHMTIYVYLLYI